jgi:hypothetical protein
MMMPVKLPAGVRESDTKFPGYKSKDRVVRFDFGTGYEETASLELWYTERMGWCIPTLLISRAARRNPNTTDRTYATTLSGDQVRIGKGPHVLRTTTVYVRESRFEALKKFLELKKNGSAKSGQIRDRISSRRAQGQQERASGNHYWKWNS